MTKKEGSKTVKRSSDSDLIKGKQQINEGQARQSTDRRITQPVNDTHKPPRPKGDDE